MTTTVLLLLVKFCRKYENQRYMKKRWPLKNKGSALFGSKSFLLIEEKNQGFMAHSLCPYYTTYHPLHVDFIDFLALLYDKIRGLNLGLCRQSETP